MAEIQNAYDRCRDVLFDRLSEDAPARIQLLTGPRQVGKTTLAKQIGLNKTENLMIGLADKLPVSVVGVAVEDAVRAARLKAQYNLPYADAFAAALTRGQHVLVTADVEHFERVPKLRLLKLPRAKKADA